MRQSKLCKPQFYGTLPFDLANKENEAASKAVELQQLMIFSLKGGQEQSQYKMIYVLGAHYLLPR